MTKIKKEMLVKMKKNKNLKLIPSDIIESKIYYLRGQKVMIDRDLAQMYGVETKVLNQAVKRNKERFPDDFIFQLTLDEYNELVTNCDRFANLKHSTSLPYAFTEQGVAMLSSVLKSRKAIKVNIAIMRVFVKIKEYAFSYKILDDKIKELERKYGQHDDKIVEVFKTLNYLIRSGEEEKKGKREIGFKCK